MKNCKYETQEEEVMNETDEGDIEPAVNRQPGFRRELEEQSTELITPFFKFHHQEVLQNGNSWFGYIF